jgi:hypothetical protein
MIAWREQTVPLSTPDTGTLKGDLEAIIAAIPDFDQAARQQLAVLIGLASAASRDPELRTALADNLLARPRRLLREILDRAVQRGEIEADRDLELLPDIVIGLNILQITLGGTPDRTHASRVLNTIIYPLATQSKR